MIHSQETYHWNKKVSLDYKRERTADQLLRGRKVVPLNSSSGGDTKNQAHHRHHYQIIALNQEKVKRPRTVDVGCLLRRQAAKQRHIEITKKLELRKCQITENLESRKCKLPEIRFKFSSPNMLGYGERSCDAARNDLFAKLTKKWAKYSNSKHENCIIINNYFR